MFLRVAITGQIGDSFGGTSDVAAWLPEMFWLLWGVTMAATAITWQLRRLGQSASRRRGQQAQQQRR